ncbi:MAG: Crp/Fnr family transcriptional regulator [Saprospiraceae bacterium]|nr:Crp/Fnr family transcriptional regulator [Saprospiraceae bacterium]
MGNYAIFVNLRKHLEETDHFTDEEFEKIVSFLTPVKLNKKDFFVRQGDHCGYLAFVNSGCLRAFHTDSNGEEFTLYFAFLNWWTGDKTSFYSGSPSRFSVQALEETEILRADRTKWETALDTIPLFEKWYRVKTRKSYEATQQRIIDMQSQSAQEKYLNLLRKAPEIVHRIPQHYIASYLGIKPQSLSRIRKNIAKGK